MSGPQLFNILPRKLPGPPRWPFELNKDSPQAQDLVFWWTPYGNLFRSHTINPDLGVTPSSAVSPTFSTHANGGLAGSWTDATLAEIDFGDETRYDLAEAITLAAWGIITDKSQIRVIISKGLGGASTHAWDLKYHNGVDKFRASLRDASAQTNFDTSVSPTLDVPFHIAVHWDNISDTGQMYLNGSASGSSGSRAGPLQTNTKNLWIAGLDDTLTERNKNEWAGELWDIRAYSVKKISSEIQELYSPGSRYDLYWEKSQRTYLFPAHFPPVAAAPTFVPYPNPRYALHGGMQDMAGGV